MKILFINPSIRPDNPRKFFPLGLGYITTAVKNAGYKFDLLDIDAQRYSDEYVENYIRDNRYDVIAFGCIVTHYKWVKYITSLIRKYQPDAKIVVGNSVATSMPEHLLDYTPTDIGVIGEGELTTVELFQRLKNDEPYDDVKGITFKKDGEFVYTGLRPAVENIDEIPYPDRDIFDMEIYLGVSGHNIHEPYPRPLEEIVAQNINTARGCAFNCGFCYNTFKEYKYRQRSPENLILEIKELNKKYGANYIQFWDDLSFLSKDRMVKFADLVISEDLDINWTGSTYAGRLGEEDFPLAQKLKESGCVAIGFSLETAIPEIHKSMNKKITLDGFIRTRKVLQKAKIATNTSLVFGYPEETPETIKRTIDFAIEQKVSPSAGFVLPMPKTAIYEYAKEVGKIPDEEEYLLSLGDRQDLHMNLTSMPDEELISNVKNGVKRYQEALGIYMEDPMKTLKKRSRDQV